MSGSTVSTSLSREGIQLGARWQFWKNTHFPRSIELCIMASALGPCKKKKKITYDDGAQQLFYVYRNTWTGTFHSSVEVSLLNLKDCQEDNTAYCQLPWATCHAIVNNVMSNLSMLKIFLDTGVINTWLCLAVCSYYFWHITIFVQVQFTH